MVYEPNLLTPRNSRAIKLLKFNARLEVNKVNSPTKTIQKLLQVLLNGNSKIVDLLLSHNAWLTSVDSPRHTD